jgi:hypothetical protein
MLRLDSHQTEKAHRKFIRWCRSRHFVDTANMAGVVKQDKTNDNRETRRWLSVFKNAAEGYGKVDAFERALLGHDVTTSATWTRSHR